MIFAFGVLALTACVIALFALAGLALWMSVGPPHRAQLEAVPTVLAERPTLSAILVLLLAGVLGALLRWAQTAYPRAAARMADELDQIRGRDPARRVTPVRSASLRRLGDAINAFADAQGRLQREAESRIAEASWRLVEERNRLAALMSELSQGVLVCDVSGHILLHNAGAAALIGGNAGAVDGAPVDLGQSVFAIIDESQIVHALDRVARGSVPTDPAPVAKFVTARGEQLLRVQLAPVLDAPGETTMGFVLTLDDVTLAIASDTRCEQLLRELTEGMRASLGNIQAAVETMQQYRDMDAAQRQRFTDVIHDEATQLSTRLAAAAAAAAENPSGPWPLEEMRARDFCHALQRSIERHLGVPAAQRGSDDTLWLSVDSHGLVHALTQAMERLVAAFGVRSVLIEAGALGRFVAVSLCWRGPPLAAETLHAWEDEPFGPGRDDQRATLSQLLLRHGAEIWSRSDPAGGLSRLCLQLPLAAQAQAPGVSAPGVGPARSV